MKYSDFLIESKKYANTKEIDLEEFKKIYASLDNKKPFFRGMKNPPSEIMLVDGSQRTRKSIDIGNYYTVLLDHTNKDYPKRSNAVIFSGGNNVDTYGKLYYVFPINNVKIASCGKKDMWQVQIQMKHLKFKTDMYEFSGLLSDLRINEDSFESIKNDIIKIIKNKKKSDGKDTKDYDMDIKSIYTESEWKNLDHKKALCVLFGFDETKVDEYINEIFNAENLYFTLYDSSKSLPDKRYPHEYWMDGKSLMIDAELFDTIRKDLD